MRGRIDIPIKNIDHFADQLIRWSRNEKYSIVLRSNDIEFENSLNVNRIHYQVLAAFGALEVFCPEDNYFESLRQANENADWLFGYLSYDLKNEIERLSSNNIDKLQFPDILLFRPSIVFAVSNNNLTIHYSSSTFQRQSAASLYDAIMASKEVDDPNDTKISPIARFSKIEYIDSVNKILNHIQRGDIYEMNFCQEFYATSCQVNPYETFIKLNSKSPTPFSAFGKFNDKFLLCASPERYLKKQSDRVFSQPIKGTAPRGKSDEEDKHIRNQLKYDEKERAENIMIVDLVRNDLSRIAIKGSVKVDELCEVYPFRQVNQMISTISCTKRDDVDNVDIIKATFPMGSMTGAPKVRAMQLIEYFERTKRGLYSGAVGYFDPQGDFDFNVVIRSILYNKTKKYLSFTVGGAITSGSNPEKEYNECILKAQAINQVLTK